MMKIKRISLVALVLVTVFSGLGLPAPARAGAREVPPDALRCLALAVYFEARGEPREGKEAVAYVVLNRAREAQFPGGVCQVVQQGGEQRPCQFGWWCDGRSDKPAPGRMWESSQDVAREVLAGQVEDPTQGALYFLRVKAREPTWAERLTRLARIGGHVFYR